MTARKMAREPGEGHNSRVAATDDRAEMEAILDTYKAALGL